MLCPRLTAHTLATDELEVGRTTDLLGSLVRHIAVGGAVKAVPAQTSVAQFGRHGSPGVWEIVQAGRAELIAQGRYRLTRLLRGQRGTAGAMGNPSTTN